MKHTQNVLLFQLQFWEAGESSAKRFDHVLPACKDKSDAILFLFSHVNKNSFAELPQMVRVYLGCLMVTMWGIGAVAIY